MSEKYEYLARPHLLTSKVMRNNHQFHKKPFGNSLLHMHGTPLSKMWHVSTCAMSSPQIGIIWRSNAHHPLLSKAHPRSLKWSSQILWTLSNQVKSALLFFGSNFPLVENSLLRQTIHIRYLFIISGFGWCTNSKVLCPDNTHITNN